MPVTGNKKVLALKLAFKNLPADIDGSINNGYAITPSSPNTRGGKRVKMVSDEMLPDHPDIDIHTTLLFFVRLGRYNLLAPIFILLTITFLFRGFGYNND